MASKTKSSINIGRKTSDTTGQKKVSGKDSTRFKPGVSGNPAGRPKGSRNKLCGRFIEDLRTIWEMAANEEMNVANMTKGQLALYSIAQARPTAFVTAVGNLVPKEFDVGDKTQGNFRALWQAMASGKMPAVDTGDDE